MNVRNNLQTACDVYVNKVFNCFASAVPLTNEHAKSCMETARKEEEDCNKCIEPYDRGDLMPNKLKCMNIQTWNKVDLINEVGNVLDKAFDKSEKFKVDGNTQAENARARAGAEP